MFGKQSCCLRGVGGRGLVSGGYAKRDLTVAAEIAFDAAMDAEVGGKTLFAIEQFERMAKSLKEKFYCPV